MEELNDLITSRKEKLKNLQEKGINAYAYKFERTHLIKNILENFEKFLTEKTLVQTAGRIISLRNHGKSCFCHIIDSDSKIQIYFKKDIIGEEKFKLFENFDIGDFIGIKGEVFKTHTNEITINVKDIEMLTKSIRPLPEKWHGLTNVETRYRQRYVDLIVNSEVKQVFKTRSQIINSIRVFLNKKNFLEVETPMMQSLPGGAEARPFITKHNALGINLYLRIAPELYLKRLLVGGFEKIYELNRNFRNEGISRFHNPEFTMLEIYESYVDYYYMMNLAEELINSLVKEIFQTLQINYQETLIDFSFPWKRITMAEAIKECLGVEVNNDNLKELVEKYNLKPDNFNKGYVMKELFENYVEKSFVNPTIVYDFPIEISPLSKQKRDNPEVVERFEIFINGMEICNAFSELNDPVEQKIRMENQVAKSLKEFKNVDEDYIKALEYGMAPAAGIGIGIDRIVMLLTNSSSIRDVIFFPQMKQEGE
ncbi:MAG: lysine--tRNA ligase [bacterium]